MYGGATSSQTKETPGLSPSRWMLTSYSSSFLLFSSRFLHPSLQILPLKHCEPSISPEALLPLSVCLCLTSPAWRLPGVSALLISLGLLPLWPSAASQASLLSTAYTLFRQPVPISIRQWSVAPASETLQAEFMGEDGCKAAGGRQEYWLCKAGGRGWFRVLSDPQPLHQ